MAQKKPTPNDSTLGGKLSVKQARARDREVKVAAFKREQARRKRTRAITIWVSAVAGAAVIALIATLVIVSNAPKLDPPSVELTGLKTWTLVGGEHVDPATVNYLAEYEMDPPAGGKHWSAWLNCGVYNEPQENERAVHSLEHGAVWVTYNPDQISGDKLRALERRVPKTFSLLSPYPGLKSPVVLSAWGAQLALTGIEDERFDSFVVRYWLSGTAPELGASCTGAVDGPGKTS